MCDSIPIFLYLLSTYFTHSSLAVCQACGIGDCLRFCRLKSLETGMFSFSMSLQDVCSLLLSTCYCWVGENFKCVIDWILMRKIKSEERELLNASSGFYEKHFLFSRNTLWFYLLHQMYHISSIFCSNKIYEVYFN